MINDVCRLDMSMTNHSFRAAFLQLLENIRSTSVNGRYGPDSFSKLRWLSLRRIYVESVELDRFEIDQLKMLKLMTLRRLILHDLDDLRILNATINSPMLQSLVIDNSYTPSQAKNIITDLGIAHIGSVFSDLEHFRLISSRSTITAGALLSILRGCQMLKMVELDCDVLKSFTALEIENLQPFGQSFINIAFPDRYLYPHHTLPSPPSVGRLKAFADLVTHCPNLKKIKLGNMRTPEYAHEGQDESVLTSLGRHCPLVEEIELVWTVRCPDAGLLLLSQNCMHVRVIEFNECNGLTDTSLAHLSQIESLQELHLSDCQTVTDAGLTALFRGCPKLQFLSILGGDFSEQGFRGLRNALCSQNLVTIYLWFHNRSLTPEFDVVMGESLACCHNLVTFSIYYYGDVSFGDAGLALMCEGCPKLEDLTLIHGETLTMDGLMHAAATCPLLRDISAEIFVDEHEDDAEGFSEADIAKFETRFPAIKFQENFY